MSTIKTVPVEKFKATCLDLLDQVQLTGEEIVVTKYGKPVARITPVGNTLEEVRKKITTKILGDVISPLEPEDWEGWDKN